MYKVPFIGSKLLVGTKMKKLFRFDTVELSSMLILLFTEESLMFST